MTYNLQGGRSFEEAVEMLFSFMGYHTRTSIVLHNRPAYIHAEMHHPKGKQRLLIECKHCLEELVGVKEVEKFCSRIAFARENAEADLGLLVSNTGFSPEAVMWCARNCSFVQLKTYKQLVSRSVNIRKLLRPFHK